MKFSLFVTLLLGLLVCSCYGKLKSKGAGKGRGGRRGSGFGLGGEFLGDSSPPPGEVYNFHVDLPSNKETGKWQMVGMEGVESIIEKLSKRHSTEMKHLHQIISDRQKIIDHLITETKKIKEAKLLV